MNPCRAIAVIAFIFLADQLSKWWVVERIFRPEALPRTADASPMPFLQWLTTAQERMVFVKLEILPFFNLTMVWNQGISFGLFNNAGDWGPVILTVMASVIMVGFIVWLFRTKSRLLALSLMLIIGGALGNIVDRIRFGAVIDFLDFHAFGWHWPSFNIADSTIVAGIALLLVHSLFLDKQTKEVSVS